MSRKRRLGMETLEGRSLPAVFGVPWTDTRAITVSFAPDGTQVGAARSDLFATMDAAMPRADWQREILRGIQAWASATGLDVVLVGDSGDPMGATGAAQGDPRFGDIRIAGTPMTAGSVSSSVPFGPDAGTWSGDMLFNTAAPFGKGAGPAYDLFTVTMHEAAHSLGIPGQTSDPSDVMYELYTGPKAGPSAAGVAAVRALYGAPLPDRFEGRTLSFHQAAWETFTAALNGRDEDAALDSDLPYAVDANLTRGDADSFAYQAGGAFTVSLKASGHSLLRGRLSVLDGKGRVVASAVTDEPGGDITLTVNEKAGEMFTLRVQGAAADEFAAGEYRLVVKPVGAGADPMARMAQEATSRKHANDTRSAATALQAMSGRWAYDGAIARVGDVDFYRLEGFKGGHLDVQVWTAGEGVTVSVLDGRGRVLATRAGGRAGVTLSLDGLAAGRYYVKVSGPAGAYTLGAQRTAPENRPELRAVGVLTAAEPQQFGGLLLPQSGVVRLEVDLTAVKAAAKVAVAVYDLDGRVVYRQTVQAGKEAEVKMFLPGGAYTVRLVAGTKDGSPLPDLPYEIRTFQLSDPIGPKPTDPTAPPTRAVTPEWYNGPFKLVPALTDPYGRPVSLLNPPKVVVLPPEKMPKIMQKGGERELIRRVESGD